MNLSFGKNRKTMTQVGNAWAGYTCTESKLSVFCVMRLCY